MPVFCQGYYLDANYLKHDFSGESFKGRGPKRVPGFEISQPLRGEESFFPWLAEATGRRMSPLLGMFLTRLGEISLSGMQVCARSRSQTKTQFPGRKEEMRQCWDINLP